ncbi:NAD(P)H-dependent oxidoreductase [Chengkuizengella axinellae]|uniref:NAD(P)H-dependent oxidoreductase n=1 Tax=Chengkuizengella axinellae TaxID=3064388 RepID=A0ABT9J629_9BACL|nr:NAD(P)H-dependent oxidoreductase [Chengkuizengella sp. 2205SS18-9]MDP5277055.1 NAD(P)H-dependent oxidoreductase [Chengkuizengella sp. 2205SS18-9]
MKTLIVIAHPSIETSTVNKRWAEELKKYPEEYTVHELFKVYPDGKIDVEKEQKLVESHGNLIFQFPIFWFNCPPLLKQWMDDVLTYGWAYGSEGDNLKNRKLAFAVSAGIKNEDYSENGRYQFTLEQILVPFKTTAIYCKADYRSFFAFYGAEYEPSKSEIEKSAHDYIKFLKKV